MPGLITVEDICRDRVSGVHPIDAHTGQRQSLEFDLARELLRATPRFWSGAALTAEFLAFTNLVDTKILSRDPIPSWASPTDRLMNALSELSLAVEEDDGRHLELLIVAVEWSSPKVWIYDIEYTFADWD